MKVDSKVLLCKDTLKCETMDDFYHCSCYDVKCDECPLSEFCNSESLEFIKLRARSYLDRMEELDKDMEEVKRIAESTNGDQNAYVTIFYENNQLVAKIRFQYTANNTYPRASTTYICK